MLCKDAKNQIPIISITSYVELLFIRDQQRVDTIIPSSKLQINGLNSMIEKLQSGTSTTTSKVNALETMRKVKMLICCFTKGLTRKLTVVLSTNYPKTINYYK